MCNVKTNALYLKPHYCTNYIRQKATAVPMVIHDNV